MREHPVFTHCGGTLSLERTAVMGILNVTPDSFSDGGRYPEPHAAVERALAIEAEGAAILDIGGQSTRPGHTPVSDKEEWARLSPVLTALRGRLRIPVSVDTYYPYVAEKALQNGAAILNDVSGSLTNGFAALAARYGAGLVMMHQGDDGADKDESVRAVRAYFEKALCLARRDGLSQEHICLDIGIGFGKSREGDLAVISRLPELLCGLPPVAVLCGASRKRVIGVCCGNPPFEERLAGTLALHTAAQLGGARKQRAHHFKKAVQAAAVTDALLTALVTDA